MSRQELREQERIEKKLKTWVLSWDSDKKRLFDKMISSEVRSQMDKIQTMYESIINECYGTSVHESIESLTVDEINQILIKANEYMDDYQLIIKENKGDIVDMLKTLEPVIKKEIKAMIKEGKDKLEGIKELRAKHKVPQNELVKMWLDVKGGVGVSKPKETVKKAEKVELIPLEESPFLSMKEIEEAQADKELKEIIQKHSPKKEIPYTVTENEIKENKEKLVDFNGVMIKEKDLEELKAIPVNEVVKELGTVEAEFVNPNKPKLKILEQTIKVQGEYGTYIKDSQGVSSGDKNYRYITEVEETKEAIKNNYNIQKGKLEKEIKELIKGLDSLAKDRQQAIEECKEIEQVFNM